MSRMRWSFDSKVSVELMWGAMQNERSGSLPYGGPCLDFEFQGFGCDIVVENRMMSGIIV